MAKRATLQEQSVSVPFLVTQFFHTGRSCSGLTLRQQIGRSTRIKSHEPKDSYDDHSYFQDGFFLAQQFMFGCGTESGWNFCTATLHTCQEIRYAILFGLLHSIPKRCEVKSHQVIQSFIRFFTKCLENVAVRFWRVLGGRYYVQSVPHRDNIMRRYICFYPIHYPAIESKPVRVFAGLKDYDHWKRVQGIFNPAAQKTRTMRIGQDPAVARAHSPDAIAERDFWSADGIPTRPVQISHS